MKYVKFALLDLLLSALSFVVGYGVFYTLSVNNVADAPALVFAGIITLGLWFAASIFTSVISNK